MYYIFFCKKKGGVHFKQEALQSVEIQIVIWHFFKVKFKNICILNAKKIQSVDTDHLIH